jgi:hypothetical protein
VEQSKLGDSALISIDRRDDEGRGTPSLRADFTPMPKPGQANATAQNISGTIESWKASGSPVGESQTTLASSSLPSVDLVGGKKDALKKNSNRDQMESQQAGQIAAAAEEKKKSDASQPASEARPAIASQTTLARETNKESERNTERPGSDRAEPLTPDKRLANPQAQSAEPQQPVEAKLKQLATTEIERETASKNFAIGTAEKSPQIAPPPPSDTTSAPAGKFDESQPKAAAMMEARAAGHSSDVIQPTKITSEVENKKEHANEPIKLAGGIAVRNPVEINQPNAISEKHVAYPNASLVPIERSGDRAINQSNASSTPDKTHHISGNWSNSQFVCPEINKHAVAEHFVLKSSVVDEVLGSKRTEPHRTFDLVPTHEAQIDGAKGHSDKHGSPRDGKNDVDVRATKQDQANAQTIIIETTKTGKNVDALFDDLIKRIEEKPTGGLSGRLNDEGVRKVLANIIRQLEEGHLPDGKFGNPSEVLRAVRTLGQDALHDLRIRLETKTDGKAIFEQLDVHTQQKCWRFLHLLVSNCEQASERPTPKHAAERVVPARVEEVKNILVSASSRDKHDVKFGETFRWIAWKALGDVRLWPLIAKLNGFTNKSEADWKATQPRAGAKLVLPTEKEVSTFRSEARTEDASTAVDPFVDSLLDCYKRTPVACKKCGAKHPPASVCRGVKQVREGKEEERIFIQPPKGKEQRQNSGASA